MEMEMERNLGLLVMEMEIMEIGEEKKEEKRERREKGKKRKGEVETENTVEILEKLLMPIHIDIYTYRESNLYTYICVCIKYVYV